MTKMKTDEPKVRQVMQLIEGAQYGNPHRGRVYDPEGIAPTICDYSQGGGRQAKIIERDNCMNIPKKIVGGVGKNNPLTILESLPKHDCMFDSRHGRAYPIEEFFPFSITTKISSNNQQFLKLNDMKGYRIRKLTPRECFRLMGVSENDIETLLNAGIADSNLYKLAGNSIVVDTLYYLFYKLFINTENENQQLTLF